MQSSESSNAADRFVPLSPSSSFPFTPFPYYSFPFPLFFLLLYLSLVIIYLVFIHSHLPPFFPFLSPSLCPLSHPYPSSLYPPSTPTILTPTHGRTKHVPRTIGGGRGRLRPTHLPPLSFPFLSFSAPNFPLSSLLSPLSPPSLLSPLSPPSLFSSLLPFPSLFPLLFPLPSPISSLSPLLPLPLSPLSSSLQRKERRGFPRGAR